MSAERSLEFLDTNVLVYAHDTTAGDKRGLALALLDRLAQERSAVVSVQVLQEFFVTVTAKLPNPLRSEEAGAIIADLSLLATHAPVAGDVLAAIEIHRRLGISFWDAMIVRSAAVLGCSAIWSEDLTAGQHYEGVEVRNPFQPA